MTHEERLNELKKMGKQFLIVKDSNDEIYESGFADYLMGNYDYINMKDGFRVNLYKPKNTVPGGEFADPN